MGYISAFLKGMEESPACGVWVTTLTHWEASEKDQRKKEKEESKLSKWRKELSMVDCFVKGEIILSKS